MIIDEKNFPKSKDKFKTKIILNVERKSYKFIITLYYDENHITIFKSFKVGVTYEIIHVFSNQNMTPLDRINFISEDKQEVSAAYFDTISNIYKRRFLLVNFPINVKLNFNKINKMKENSSYKINILPHDIIVQENQESKLKNKIKLDDFNKMKNIVKDIDEFIKKDRINMDFNEMKKIINKLNPYENYFNQNLMDKEDNNWNQDELTFYYHYFLFKLYLNYATIDDSSRITYYYSAMKIFKNIYKELDKISNVNIYEKICGLVSLYMSIKSDCDNKENKCHLIGEYKLLNMNNNKIKCYNLAYEFIFNIIDNLKENSFIFLPLLQVNSGFKRNINSDDGNDIFELSMINVNMVKRHLKILMPKLFFLIRHPTISSKRGSTCTATGNMFIYESSIFKNNIGKEIDTIINEQPEDAAIIISFVILHEVFMHKKIRSNDDFVTGKETPSKFIGPKYDIKNFYYTNNKNNADPLSIYNKDKGNENKISKDGECGKILEYFFENKNFEIINYLKKYIGFGELLKHVDLIVDEKLDKLHSYVINKIKDGKVKPLRKEKSKKNNQKQSEYNENDEDEKKGKMEEEEEGEEEEDSDEELSEETKRILSLETD